jgi:HAMP domain-containing protein/HPt (histidine-containing phosphotransfer) domain-containing protein
MRRLSIKAKVMLVVALVLSAGGAGILWIIHRAHQDNLDLMNRQSLSIARESFAALERDDTRMLSSTMLAVLRDQRMRTLFLARDRERLWQEANPLFQDLRRDYGITQFNFIDPPPANTIFLRMRQPSYFGDVMKRVTYQESVKTEGLASGKELGKTAFALRVIHPWKDDEGHIIGYLELGQEINSYVGQMKARSGNDYAVLLVKRFLDAKEWAAVRSAAKLANNWDDDPHTLLITSTSNSASLYQFVGSIESVPDEGVGLGEVESDGKTYLRGILPIRDAARNKVGGIFVLQDVTGVHQRMQRVRRLAFIAVGALMLVLSALIVRLFSYLVLRRVEHLKRSADRLAAGHLDERVSVKSQDEIGHLARSFNEMAVSIQDGMKQLADHKDKLEEMVEERTRQLALRNDEMRIVLGTVDQGLAMVDKEGRLGAERSTKFVEWFPSDDPRALFFDVIATHDEQTATMLRLGWDSLVEDVLPTDLLIEQMPKRIRKRDRTFALSYKPVMRDGAFAGALLSVSDITQELKRLKTEAERAEFLNVFERMMRDRIGFVEFFNESSAMVDRFAKQADPDPTVVMRQIHTLKGNASIIGVSSVAEACHEVETRIAENGAEHAFENLSPIVEVWCDFSNRVVPVMGGNTDDTVSLSHRDLDDLLTAIRRGTPHATLVGVVERLRYEPIEARLRRVSAHATSLAYRLGRPEPIIIINGNGVRMPSDGWGEFWSAYVHLVRNAVDHGLETAEEREGAGKPVHGTLRFTVKQIGTKTWIELEDDGRGVDWDRVREKARARHLPHMTDEELTEALFFDGLSTREVVTAFSGRGVGMSAVRAACRALRGDISVASIKGKGTTVRIAIPVRASGFPSVSQRPDVLANGRSTAPSSPVHP